MADLVHAPEARPGDKVALISPSFAAPAVEPAVHEQAMRRLTEVTGLVPVEDPTTRQLGASPRDRAADLSTAFTDPQIRAVLAMAGRELDDLCDELLARLLPGAVATPGVAAGHRSGPGGSAFRGRGRGSRRRAVVVVHAVKGGEDETHDAQHGGLRVTRLTNGQAVV
jgi:hypothetical protein